MRFSISPCALGTLWSGETAMREHGDLSGIVFNRRTGNLVGGHQRLKHLRPEWEILKEDFTDDLGTGAQGFVKTPFGDWLYREVDWPEKKRTGTTRGRPCLIS